MNRAGEYITAFPGLRSPNLQKVDITELTEVWCLIIYKIKVFENARQVYATR